MPGDTSARAQTVRPSCRPRPAEIHCGNAFLSSSGEDVFVLTFSRMSWLDIHAVWWKHGASWAMEEAIKLWSRWKSRVGFLHFLLTFYFCLIEQKPQNQLPLKLCGLLSHLGGRMCSAGSIVFQKATELARFPRQPVKCSRSITDQQHRLMSAPRRRTPNSI